MRRALDGICRQRVKRICDPLVELTIVCLKLTWVTLLFPMIFVTEMHSSTANSDEGVNTTCSAVYPAETFS